MQRLFSLSFNAVDGVSPLTASSLSSNRDRVSPLTASSLSSNRDGVSPLTASSLSSNRDGVSPLTAGRLSYISLSLDNYHHIVSTSRNERNISCLKVL